MNASKLHIESCGQGQDLVLLHGWGMHSGIWQQVVKTLTYDYKIHCIDLPGHGLNKQFECKDYSLEAVTTHIASNLQALLTGKAICIGWSLGGLIAYHLASQFPEMIRGLVIIATSPCFNKKPHWEHAMPIEILDEFNKQLLENYQATILRFLSLQSRNGENAKACLRQLHESVFARGEPQAKALIAALKILRDTDLRTKLNSITQPCLLIGGERDTLVPSEALSYSVDQLPNAKLTLMKGAGHAPFISHCEPFNQHLHGFLENGI